MPTGYIGLGTIGKTIARHLIEEGVDLVVWNRTRSKAHDLGVPVAATPADLAAQCDPIILNLRDSDAVHAVLHSDNGLLSADLTGKTVIDTTTNEFRTVQRFHALVTKAGAHYIEAPVLGSIIPAATGSLAVYVSGPEPVFNTVRPLLEKIGARVEYFAQPGTATALKLINNMVMGTFLATLVEALLLGEAVGVPKVRMLDLLEKGSGKSGVLTAKKDKLLAEDFTTHFAAELIHKDLAYAAELARVLERPLITGDAAKAVYALVYLQDKAGLDFSVIYDILKGDTREQGH